MKNLRWIFSILAAIIITPAVIIGAIFIINSSDGSGGSSLKIFSIDSYLSEIENTDIEKWLNNINIESEQAYVLKHQEDYDAGVRVHYLIYLPQLVENPTYSFGANVGLLDDILKVAFEKNDGNGGNTLALVSYSGESEPKFKLYYDGKLMKCEITEVDYDIDLTDESNPKYSESDIDERLPSGDLNIQS